MADSASIAVGASDYRGDVGLGGGTFGFVKLDTKPIEDLARYTMLYNKSEYDQRQKDAEKAAEEIADMTSYDLTSGIEKDAKILQEKYEKLTNYVRDNPNALDYRNKEEWAKYKKMRNELDNDLQGAKVRSTMWALRQKEIQDEKNPAEKARLQAKLDAEISATDIRTPLKYSDKFDVQPVEVGPAVTRKVQTTQVGSNIIGQATTELPDIDVARNTADAIVTGLVKIVDKKGTFPDQYEAAVASEKLEPILSSQAFNAALQQYKSDPKYLNPDGTLNIDKLIELNDNIISPNLRNIKAVNENLDKIVNAVDNGYFMDDFGGELKFSTDGSGLRKSSYAKIDINDADGYSPRDLVLTKMLAQTPGMSRTIDIKNTGFGIDRERIAVQKRGQDLDYKVAMSNVGLRGQELEFAKIKEGWKWENKKLVPPKTGSAITAQGGVVPYWQNYIAPQITTKDLFKDKKFTDAAGTKYKKGSAMPPNFSGDIEVNSDQISGLSIALLGEVSADGKQVGYTSETETKIRYQNGVPVGVVINEVFYDQNDINSKATEAENKSVTNKFDKTLYQGTQQPTGDEGLTDAQYFLKYKKARTK